MDNINGVLLVDKPKGITSQTLITKIKRHLNIKKVGHAGTLDPLATGLMVVLLGSSTKLSDYLMSNEKEYECEILIGSSSDTEDIEGNILAEKEVKQINNIDLVLAGLKGTLSQIPPMYSSVHHNGVKLYELARKGIEVEREPRVIEVKDIKRTSDVIYENQKAKFTFKACVSKGTYIRTLCVEIGARIEYPALMSNLRRVKSGTFKIDDAYKLDDILNDKYKVLSNYEAIKDKNLFEVDEKTYKDIMNGKEIILNSDKEQLFITYKKELIAVYNKIENNLYKAKRVWN